MQNKIIKNRTHINKKLVSSIAKIIGVSTLGIQLAQGAGGNQFIVTSTADQPQVGLTTFREAVEQANGVSESEIVFDNNLFNTAQTIALENGEILISSSVFIEGPGAHLLTIDGQDMSRILTIDDDSSTINSVTISGITLTNGNGVSENAVNLENNRGGCIFTKESLTVRRSVVNACESSVDGGGVSSLNAELNIIDSEISNNSTAFKGGGIKSQGGQLTITNSTISGNNANRSSFAGAAIETSRTPLVIVNSTISNNQSREGATGGISIYQSSDLTLLNTTVVNNTGGGINLRRASLVNVSNSIIADNSDGDCDFSNISDQSENQNNLDTDGSCDVFASSHITVNNPMLEPLANFGGDTQTHRPLPDSPVIDAGDNFLCLEFDQRGEVRPQDGDGDGTAECDIGAVELAAFEDIIFINDFDN